MNYIYGLFCPVDLTIRYIGKSNNPDLRLQQHLTACAHSSHHSGRWLAKLKRSGQSPTLTILAELDDAEDWQQAERNFIASSKAYGWRLTNTTPGGEGGGFVRPEDREAWVSKVTDSLRDPEVRAKISAGVLRAYQNPEVRDKAVMRQKKRWEDPSYREKACRQAAEAASRPENRKKASERGKRLMAQHEAREHVSAKLTAYYATDEGRQNKRQVSNSDAKREASRRGQIRNWQDPLYRGRLMAAKTSPETLTKQKDKARGQWADPEVRARMLLAMETARAKRKSDGLPRMHKPSEETSSPSVQTPRQ